MDEILDQLQKLAATAKGVARQRLMSSLHKLAYSMETSDDTLHRYGAMNLQTATVKIGIDLGLFKHMAESKTSVTIEEISKTLGVELLLLSRIMRYLDAIGVIEQVSGNQYAANHLTRNLAERVTEAGINHYFCTVARQYQALPAFLKKNGYRNPSDEMNTVFQDAWSTSLDGFSWFTEHPENLAFFNEFMAFRRQPELSWLTVYPVEQEVKEFSPERPIYVNIGGGLGHQCAEFKRRYPHLSGRVILQDLPHSIAQAFSTPGVENMTHNFFEPQPVHGAKFYFMRGVLHNHPPHKARKLLENIKSAMLPESILLVDEMILPEAGTHVDAASMDLTMLSAFAGMERTEAQWRSIIDEAGLSLREIYVYNPVSHESVMDLRLPMSSVE